jgi:hypothetical protein
VVAAAEEVRSAADVPDRRLQVDFDRQLERLVALGYPAFSGRSDAEFTENLLPLRGRVAALPRGTIARDVPFVIVVNPEAAPPTRCMPLVEHRGRDGVVDMTPTEPADYLPIGAAQPPVGFGYLVYGIDAGRDTLNVTPNQALPRILAQGRSPLTIQEGIALLTHVSSALRSLNAFSLLGSRRGDKRVPALWVSKGRPRLGWCWVGNPHTWLGSASCAGRLGVE